nr:uncharacterized protein LOC127347653 [Lolium perenne]
MARRRGVELHLPSSADTAARLGRSCRAAGGAAAARTKGQQRGAAGSTATGAGERGGASSARLAAAVLALGRGAAQGAGWPGPAAARAELASDGRLRAGEARRGADHLRAGETRAISVQARRGSGHLRAGEARATPSAASSLPHLSSVGSSCSWAASSMRSGPCSGGPRPGVACPCSGRSFLARHGRRGSSARAAWRSDAAGARAEWRGVALGARGRRGEARPVLGRCPRRAREKLRLDGDRDGAVARHVRVPLEDLLPQRAAGHVREGRVSAAGRRGGAALGARRGSRPAPPPSSSCSAASRSAVLVSAPVTSSMTEKKEAVAGGLQARVAPELG